MQQRAQDAVVVEACDRVEQRADVVDEVGDGAAVGIVTGPRVEPRDEQLDEAPRMFGVASDGLFDVRLAEQRSRLAQVAAVRADERDLAPRQIRREHEAIEAVVLGATVDHREEGFFEHAVRRTAHDDAVRRTEAEPFHPTRAEARRT